MLCLLLGIRLNTEDLFPPLLHLFQFPWVTTFTKLTIPKKKKYFKYYLNWIRQILLGSSLIRNWDLQISSRLIESSRSECEKGTDTKQLHGQEPWPGLHQPPAPPHVLTTAEPGRSAWSLLPQPASLLSLQPPSTVEPISGPSPLSCCLTSTTQTLSLWSTPSSCSQHPHTHQHAGPNPLTSTSPPGVVL